MIRISFICKHKKPSRTLKQLAITFLYFFFLQSRLLGLVIGSCLGPQLHAKPGAARRKPVCRPVGRSNSYSRKALSNGHIEHLLPFFDVCSFNANEFSGNRQSSEVSESTTTLVRRGTRVSVSLCKRVMLRIW